MPQWADISWIDHHGIDTIYHPLQSKEAQSGPDIRTS